jgi:putative transposase
MPRAARIKSETGIYHIMLRGINRQNIFNDEEDNEKFIEALKKSKEISNFEIYAYCLMGNHVHIVIYEREEGIDQIIKRIGTRYAYWYNKKYERMGHLFQDRYKSEPVEDNAYFLTVLRYILRNPIKAGLCKRIEEYKWSSYSEYIKGSGTTDTQYALDILSRKKEEQRDVFMEYINTSTDDECLELEEKKNRRTDEEVIKDIREKYEVEAPTIANLPYEKQENILKYLKGQDGVSLRQISRITGFNVNKVFKA